MSEVEMVKMAVNQDVCIGAGQCEMLAEDTFLVDDDTVVAGVIGDGMLPRDLADKIVSTCPTQAISIVEEPSGDGSVPAGEDVRSPVEEPSGDGSVPAGEDVRSAVEEPSGDGSVPAGEEE